MVHKLRNSSSIETKTSIQINSVKIHHSNLEMNPKYFLLKSFLSQLIFTDSNCFIEIEIAKEKIPRVLSKSSLRNLKQQLIWKMIKANI